MTKLPRKRWLLGGLLACMTASGAWALDVPLKYAKFPEYDRGGGSSTQEYYPRSMMFRGGSPEDYKLPPGDWKLPKLFSKYPIFYQVEIGSEKRLMVIDQKNKQDNYTRLYFDANGNRDLTDDKPIDGEFDKKNGWSNKGVDFPIIECTLTIDGHKTPYAFQPVLQEIEQWKKNHQFAMIGQGLACWYVGECTLEGRRYRIGIYDDNNNGRFGEFCSIPTRSSSSSDRFYLSGDEMFIIPADGPGNRSGTPLCNRICVGPKVYDVALDMAQGMLKLTETKDTLVGVRLPKGMNRLTLINEKGDLSLSAVAPGETLNVPEGSYRLLAYSGTLKDPQGNDWSVSANATGKTPLVKADAKAENPFQIGAPIKARASVPSWVQDNIRNGMTLKEVNLEFAMYDAGERQLGSLSCTTTEGKFEKSKQSPSMPKEPTYEIFADGKKVTSGSFEYG